MTMTSPLPTLILSSVGLSVLHKNNKWREENLSSASTSHVNIYFTASIRYWMLCSEAEEELAKLQIVSDPPHEMNNWHEPLQSPVSVPPILILQ